MAAYNLKKTIASAVVACTLLGSSTAFAALSPSYNNAQRMIYNVTDTSVTIRSQPNNYSPIVAYNYQGNDLVETTAGETGTYYGDYVYYQIDYVNSSTGQYSDSVSGYTATSNWRTGAYYVGAVSAAKNYTSSANNFWSYSDLTVSKGTFGPGVSVPLPTINSATGGAANDNPNAWYANTSWSYPSDVAWINGWYVDAY